MSDGYFLHPTVHKDGLVFVGEEDLWQVSIEGGSARRLTAGRGAFSRPRFSPDGKWIAATAQEEGYSEIFVLPSEGGEVKRLTYLGSQSYVVGWSGADVLFSSAAGETFVSVAYRVNGQGGTPQKIPLGPATSIAISAAGVVIERSSRRSDPSWWKGYRGGTAGKLWIGRDLTSEFKPLAPFQAQLSSPLWVKDRIFFLSDPEGLAQVYSCDRAGKDIRQHTRMKEFYARNPSTDGKTLVFHAGGELFALDLRTNRVRALKIRCSSQRTQRQRKVVEASQGFEDSAVHPRDGRVAVGFRGKIVEGPAWDGALRAHGSRSDSRSRMGRWLQDGRTFVYVSDDTGEEKLVVETEGKAPHVLKTVDIGRVVALVPAPEGSSVILTNHRNELILVDVLNSSARLIDRDPFNPLGVPAFSPDGRWIAYGRGTGIRCSRIFVADAKTGKSRAVTSEFLTDFSPAFDPQGRYLYLLTDRELDPVYDRVHFELSFPKATLAALLPLKSDTPSPFIGPLPDPPEKSDKGGKKGGRPRVDIDFEGIESRMLLFPMAAAGYSKIRGVDGQKVLLLSHPVEGSLKSEWLPGVPAAKGRLETYDLSSRRAETFLDGVTDFEVSADGKRILVRAGNRLRLLPVDGKTDKHSSDPGPKSGWIDLDRFQSVVDPAGEWRQMLGEIWRLQRDFFWDPGMSRVKWKRVFERYLPLVERVSTRSDFSDLVWEMQGELGTSHAYDIGGDYRRPPVHRIGFLGAELSSVKDGIRVDRLLRGDSWNSDEASPLGITGVQAKPGDVIVSVNGRPTAGLSPGEAFLHLSGTEVEIALRSGAKGRVRRVLIRTLKDEHAARYRDWVESNREFVAKASQGKLGYIHIPNMVASGFSEFHRAFLRDFDKDGLVVDLRYNGGGHVSQLLMEKLGRKRLGLCRTRWFGDFPTPDESPTGVMAAVTNEYAGSDGDIGSHTFKMRGLGPLVGKRTWGGVVGIWPRQTLMDGSVTTQPEFAHWFQDVGWEVENYGTDPDFDVDIAPHDWRDGKDPQLSLTVDLLMDMLKEIGKDLRPSVKEMPDRSRGLA
jgi:tricorn protease